MQTLKLNELRQQLADLPIEEAREVVARMLLVAIADKDTESAHATADTIMAEFVYRLGEHDIAALYEQVDGWYA